MSGFKMIGNLYFVGTKPASSHMIDTGDGLILIDVGYEETADVVVQSLNDLGYDVRDVKYILLSHGHYDHSDGVPKIKALSNATVFMDTRDNKYLKGFTPDVCLKDGDIVTLGNTEILCLHTPGHTEGTFSFFLYVEENGIKYRTGMFGGAGVPQLSKQYLDKNVCSYHQRRQYLESLERLRNEQVDVFVGNHVGQNKTYEKYELLATAKQNPYIDPTEWRKFLDSRVGKLDALIEDEIKTEFVNYAHRGASEYLPENTLLSFYTGIYMGANGIETDVRRAKDGTLVLFHDQTLERVTGECGAVEDYTYEELQAFDVKKGDFCDKIVSLEEFLKRFSFRDITFAIELKGENIEKDTADLLRKYDMRKKTIVTSFKREYIEKFKKCAPEFRIGHLVKELNDDIINKLIEIDADEICPRADLLTKENVKKLHADGFRVRAWGVSDEALMKHAVECGADGMTVNFPDKLTQLIKEKSFV